MTESSSRDADDCNAACSNGSRWRQHPLMSFVAGLTLVAAALLFLNSSVQLEGGSMLFAAPTSNNLVRHARTTASIDAMVHILGLGWHGARAVYM